MIFYGAPHRLCLIGLFNRCRSEEVMIVRIHPQIRNWKGEEHTMQ